jgi:hypothetical protein
MVSGITRVRGKHAQTLLFFFWRGTRYLSARGAGEEGEKVAGGECKLFRQPCESEDPHNKLRPARSKKCLFF